MRKWAVALPVLFALLAPAGACAGARVAGSRPHRGRRNHDAQCRRRFRAGRARLRAAGTRLHPQRPFQRPQRTRGERPHHRERAVFGGAATAPRRRDHDSLAAHRRANHAAAHAHRRADQPRADEGRRRSRSSNRKSTTAIPGCSRRWASRCACTPPCRCVSGALEQSEPEGATLRKVGQDLQLLAGNGRAPLQRDRAALPRHRRTQRARRVPGRAFPRAGRRRILRRSARRWTPPAWPPMRPIAWCRCARFPRMHRNRGCR